MTELSPARDVDVGAAADAVLAGEAVSAATAKQTASGSVLGASSAVFTTTFGAYMALPLLAVFFHNDLGLTDTRDIAFWSGFATSMGPLAAGFAGPFWGIAADRVGRRGMLIRAVLAAGSFTGALSLVQAPVHAVILRTFSGATSGVGSGAVALVAAEVPRERLGRALGMITTARSLGQSVGPAVGGLLGSLLPLRLVFALGGLIIAVGVIPIITKVRESKKIMKAARPSIRAALRQLSRDTRFAIVVLIGATALGQFAFAGAQQLLLVRIIQIDPARASLASGLAFAAISLSSAVAGTTYSRFVVGRGYRLVAIVAAISMAIAIGAESLVVTIPLLIGCAAIFGLGYGAHMPAASSMLALETPNAVKSTIFGFGSSGQSLGGALGAFSGGLLGATLGPTAGLLALAGAAALSAITLTIAGREPA